VKKPGTPTAAGPARTEAPRKPSTEQRLHGRGLLWGRAASEPAASASIDPTEGRLRDAVARQPGNPAAHAELGRYFLSLERPTSALWELEEARALGATGRVNLGRDRAKALALAGHRDLAIAELRALLAAPPGAYPAETETWSQLAELLLAAGRPAEAIGVLLPQRGVEQSPEATMLIGRADHALGRLADAEAAFRSYARIAPPDTARFEPLGRFLLATGRAEEARRALMQDQQVSFQRADFHYLLGLTYWRAQPRPDLRKATGAFNVALHFNARHPRVHTALGEILEQQGARDQAGAEYEAAIEADPSQPEPHTRLASLLMKMGHQEPSWEQRGIAAMLEDRKPDAVSAYRRMLAAAPDDLQAAKALILACVGMKQIGRTQPVVDALRRRPLDPAEAGLISDLYLMTNARGPCRQLAAAWYRLQPESPGSLRLLGRLAFDDLHVEEAIRLYEAAWARDPHDADAAASMGHVRARVPTRAHLEQARDWFQRAVALEPTHAKYHADRARVDQQLGQAGPAQDEYLRALDLDSSLSSAAGSLSQLGQAKHRPALARLFGQMARALDDRTLAIDQAHHRLWDHPDDAEAELALARLMVDAGALEMARVHLQQALARRPVWEPALTLQRTVEVLLVWS
jgi:tetratricopeptide (TPR) repeat protein